MTGPQVGHRSPCRRLALLVPIAASLLLAACVSPVRSDGAGPRAEAGLDLGLLGPETPALLVEVAHAPYAMPPQPDCAWIHGEIAGLDRILGPDVDAKPSPVGAGQQLGRAATGAVVGMVPYRGVIRWVSGAGRKERDRAQAVLSAAARRGFLKGIGWSRACAVGDR